VAAIGVTHPHRVRSMVLFSPAGGVKYRMKQHQRFEQHLAYVDEQGLDAVVRLARETGATFTKDPRVGPWNSVLRADESFAADYAKADPARYRTTVSGLVRLLFDRDTVPGPEPEDLLTCDVPALIVPGQDDSHAPSAARYLQECLPVNEYWDVPVSTRPRRRLRRGSWSSSTGSRPAARRRGASAGPGRGTPRTRRRRRRSAAPRRRRPAGRTTAPRARVRRWRAASGSATRRRS